MAQSFRARLRLQPAPTVLQNTPRLASAPALLEGTITGPASLPIRAKSSCRSPISAGTIADTAPFAATRPARRAHHGSRRSPCSRQARVRRSVAPKPCFLLAINPRRNFRRCAKSCANAAIAARCTIWRPCASWCCARPAPAALQSWPDGPGWIDRLRHTNPSLGLMLESTSTRT